ncbi:MAG: DUF3098 domain-containing protein [Bacteroidales bacterium]|jgi:hypothetical protein|nr:DUF3098 domain-containing protein [Bacteroidales bacterium]
MKDNKLSKPDFVFGKKNYIIFFIGLALMLIGYILMTGGGSDNPEVFNEKMFDFRRLTLSPLCILVGIVFEIFAIFYKSKNKEQ